MTARTTGKVLCALDDIFDSSRPLAGEEFDDEDDDELMVVKPQSVGALKN